jgi:hypothetical protein
MTHFIDLTPIRARFAPRCRSAIEEWRGIERRERIKSLRAGILDVMAGILMGAGLILLLWRLLP